MPRYAAKSWRLFLVGNIRTAAVQGSPILVFIKEPVQHLAECRHQLNTSSDTPWRGRVNFISALPPRTRTVSGLPSVASWPAFSEFRGQFGFRAVRLPDNLAVAENFQDDAAERAAQGFHAAAGFEFGGFTKAFNHPRHAFPVKHAGDEVRGGGRNFLAAMKRKLMKQRRGQGAADFREGVAIVKQKRGATMAGLEKLKSFQQGQLGRAALFPFFRNPA